jgi:hypothetical protein
MPNPPPANSGLANSELANFLAGLPPSNLVLEGAGDLLLILHTFFAKVSNSQASTIMPNPFTNHSPICFLLSSSQFLPHTPSIQCQTMTAVI